MSTPVDIEAARKLAEEAIAIATGCERKDAEESFRKTGDLGLSAELRV